MSNTMDEVNRVWELFHKLWGKGSGGPLYDKNEWIELQKLLEKKVSDVSIPDLLAWMKSRPGASWVATVKDVEIAFAVLRQPSVKDIDS